MPPPNRLRPLPNDTARILPGNLAGCKNLGLLLDKFQPWDYQEHLWSFTLRERDHGEIQLKKKEAKSLWLSTTRRPGAGAEPSLFSAARFDEKLHRAWVKRWQENLAAFQARVFAMVAQTRLVVGLGSKGTLEMGLTLHPRYGFPYIPASTLKGLARTAALFEIANRWGVPGVAPATFLEIKKDKGKTPLNKLEALLEAPVGPARDPRRHQALQQAYQKLAQDQLVKATGKLPSFSDLLEDEHFNSFREVFGCLSEAGKVIFWDAVPLALPVLVTEIMNAHYPKYYNKTKFPTDDQSPNPVAYLALESGQRFGFGLSVRPGKDPNLLNPAQGWLVNGLKEHGVGGKTSSGMGVFDTQPPPKAVEDDREAEPPRRRARPAPTMHTGRESQPQRPLGATDDVMDFLRRREQEEKDE